MTTAEKAEACCSVPAEQQQRSAKNWLAGSFIGTIVVAVCCFTPLLVVLLTAVGLGALTGYLDWVLLPALVVFLLLTIWSFIRWQRAGRIAPGRELQA